MLNQILTQIYERDLNKLKDEINAYADEAALWRIEKGITNSAGNLCLHITGNLQHFIGATLGASGYVRDRDSEFALKNIPRAQLIADIEKTIGVIHSTLSKLDEKDWAKIYPLKVLGEEHTTAYFLTHLTGHLSYHLGQINYHRRLIGN